eukprot:scaffold37778_cov229-Amphora_coffeaeformis.AAC.1
MPSRHGIIGVPTGDTTSARPNVSRSLLLSSSLSATSSGAPLVWRMAWSAATWKTACRGNRIDLYNNIGLLLDTRSPEAFGNCAASATTQSML